MANSIKCNCSILLLCESCFKCLLLGTMINLNLSIKGRLKTIIIKKHLTTTKNKPKALVSKEINFLAGLCFSLRQILMSVQRGSLSVTTIHAVLTSQGGTTVSAEAVSMTMEAILFPGSPVLVSNDHHSAFFCSLLLLHGVIKRLLSRCPEQWLCLRLKWERRRACLCLSASPAARCGCCFKMHHVFEWLLQEGGTWRSKVWLSALCHLS